MSIPNTFETIGLDAGGRHGFTDGFGYGVMACLLADHLNAGAVAFGSVMEGVTTLHGCFFEPRSRLHQTLFEAAGLDFALPLGGVSEVAVCQILVRAGWQRHVVFCALAAEDGTPCGQCHKCFRKIRLMDFGNPEPDWKLFVKFAERPMPTPGSTIYACQKSGWWHPTLVEYRDVRLDFLERYYAPAVGFFLPDYLASRVRDRLDHYGVRPMNADDETRFKAMGAIFWPEKYHDASRTNCAHVPR